VWNTSKTQPFALADSPGVLEAGQSCVLRLPFALLLGQGPEYRVEVQAAPGAQTGAAPAQAPAGPEGPRLESLPSLVLAPRGLLDNREVLRLLSGIVDVLQAAAGSRDFFARATRAMVEMADLDSGWALRLEGDDWVTEATYFAPGSDSTVTRGPSRHALAPLRDKRCSLQSAPTPAPGEAPSLAGVKALVAAPILAPAGEVLGALYGERRRPLAPGSPGPITPVHVKIVELMARGVAAGLARVEQEKEAVIARIRFEQFFTPDLARQLSVSPDLLLPRDAQVTLLFADVRAFSRISERLGPARTVEWVRAVFDELSGCVLNEDGALVNYVGDELVAMWGAPGEQPDHAARACRCALAMLARLSRLNERWQGDLGEPLELGIGINTGLAQVGNIGSRFKFHYGPLGNTVNLASRAQGATRHLKCRVLITRATREALGEGLNCRRLGQLQVKNIAAPFEAHELVPEGLAHWPEARAVYEQALAQFEAGDFAQAARALGDWRSRCLKDGPALVLLARAVNCMVEGPPPEHPVLALRDK
jgi:adenylate cyclase